MATVGVKGLSCSDQWPVAYHWF